MVSWTLQHTEKMLLHAILKLTSKDLITNFPQPPGCDAEMEVLGGCSLQILWPDKAEMTDILRNS